MKKALLIIVSIYSLNILSQNNIKPNTSFELHLIQEGIMVIKDKLNKNYLYNPDLIDVELDTIGDYNAEVLFLRFRLGSNLVRPIDNNIKILFNSSSCNEFILAYNTVNYRSYRLKGFNGNDLLFMLKDINTSSSSKKSYKKLLSILNESIAELNFKGIYKALLNFDFDGECLKVCSDGKATHGKR